MKLRVFHKTEYQYSAPVVQSINELRLKPRESDHQKVEHSLISVIPAAPLKRYTDFNRNHVHHLEIPNSHQKLSINSNCTVVTSPPLDLDQLPYGFSHSDLLQYKNSEEHHPFTQDSSYIEKSPIVWREALDIQGASTDVFQTANAIMEFIFKNFNYLTGVTSANTHANDVITGKAGVCQDFAHAMIAYCRAVDIPARYVSGYFFDATVDHSLRGDHASHAWVEVFIENHGWIALDPTNMKVVDETYITLAIGRDYRDVAPISGTYFGNAHCALDVSVRVTRQD